MAEGTIKRLTDKGYGFINTGKEKDLFFHSSSVQDCSFEELREGQRCRSPKAGVRKAPAPRTSSRCSCEKEDHEEEPRRTDREKGAAGKGQEKAGSEKGCAL